MGPIYSVNLIRNSPQNAEPGATVAMRRTTLDRQATSPIVGIGIRCNTVRAKPFLRWAGSKRKQLSKLMQFWTDRHSRYIEPFTGSGCLFFALAPHHAILGDRNRDLMEVYQVVRDEPERLYRRLCRIRRDISTYQRWRSMNPERLDLATRALRFVYLNRNCFNGIYRTNLRGEFNVPMGKRTGTYFSADDIMHCSRLLRNTRLLTGDFAKTLSFAKRGDFVYLDPPFAMTGKRVFREYGKEVFQVHDIPRLSEALVWLDQIGADFLVSYADCAEARHMLKDWNSVRIPIQRQVAGFSRHRSVSFELLVTNCQMPADVKKLSLSVTMEDRTCG
jgi:DNA adenine methylase